MIRDMKNLLDELQRLQSVATCRHFSLDISNYDDSSSIYVYIDKGGGGKPELFYFYSFQSMNEQNKTLDALKTFL